MTHLHEREDSQNILWQPSVETISNSRMKEFMEMMNEKYEASIENYEDLHAWSVNDIERFWSECWDFVDIRGERGKVSAQNTACMTEARFFPQSRFNLAENCLRRRDSRPAIIFTQENVCDRIITWKSLYGSVGRLKRRMESAGVKKGDRCCGVLANVPEAVICMLATGSIGAIWSSISPDFGADGILERFGQIEPKILFYSDWYKNKNRTYDISDRIREVEKVLGSGVLSVCVTDGGLEAFCEPEKPLEEEEQIIFAPTSFNDPMFIMFSSGTTGKPKCILHRHGVLLQLMKEHQLHCDMRASDRVFYFTTTTWMMWHWLVTCLASETSIMLYEGNPFYPNCNSLFDFAGRFECTFFGVSAKFIDSLRSDSGFAENPKLPFVRMIASTGSPLSPESFDFVYQKIKRDVILASICGGTDIVSCFMLGCPMKPVKRGFAQCRGLGMDVQVWSDEDDKSFPMIDQKGELVCCKPFVSQPIGFWGHDTTKYKETYFARFPNVWTHGDFVKIDHDGYMLVYGRSDATMKPGGVRIGTAEIYRAVENLKFIRESVCCGVTQGQDEIVALFVVLRDSTKTLCEEMKLEIRTSVGRFATRHHVPKIIEQVKDIPRTKNGKIVELAVKNVLHHVPVVNFNALANPEALAEFERFAVV